MNFFLEYVSPRMSVYWIVAMWVASAVVHVGFALAVLVDSQLYHSRLRKKTFLVGGALWSLATLLGGVFVAGIYWLVHHSSLRPAQPLPGVPVSPVAPDVQR